MPDRPRVLDRVDTPRGELVLRGDGEHVEVISNGVFLMDTRDGASERLLVRAALDRHPAPRLLLIGGLGVGFSLVEALADHRVERVIVIEREQAIVDWHRSWLAPWSSGALDDPRTTVMVADLADVLKAATGPPDGGADASRAVGATSPVPGPRDLLGAVDVACLDTDNGPDWLVSEDNAVLYSAVGLQRLRRVLAPGGLAAFWSASASPAFAVRLAEVFEHLETLTVPSSNAPRGEPDVVYVARRSHLR
jgi:spermidine synthase